MTRTVFCIITCLLLTRSGVAQDSLIKTSAFHDGYVNGFFNYLNDGSIYGMGITGGYYHNIYAEARYNYEDLQTFSLFAGYSFSNDRHAVEWELIPMAGFAMGNTKAFLPGMEATLQYKRFNFTTQTEYAVNLENKTDNFFYTWSEFTYTILPWLEPGIVVQRSKLYKSGREVDRGLMLNAVFLPKATASAYFFDPFDPSRRFFIIGLNYSF
ncbi:hypothetical protein [Flavihumibacter fluvii]|uniref:hypothetical protein n=1 Tax=Flavihumibacter fluvii TaxID=2838157 RepID=UPI001BDF6389|nr:hypothetical protein [Flavihumibacter fluvii]ULQ53302.1 hypothetical protein KJS93_03095 [Flavihumibacter fluvii]